LHRAFSCCRGAQARFFWKAKNVSPDNIYHTVKFKVFYGAGDGTARKQLVPTEFPAAQRHEHQ